MTSREILIYQGENEKEIAELNDIQCDTLVLNGLFRPMPNIHLTREAIVHWYTNLYEPFSRLAQNVYNSWSNAARFKYFKHVYPNGLVNLPTQQLIIGLCLSRDSNIQDAISEYDYWKSYIKEKTVDYLEEVKGRRLSIFEHTLSQYGCYDLYINEDSTSYLIVYVYGCPSIVKGFKTIEEAFEYVKENHYYE